jgi:hypothetical protein
MRVGNGSGLGEGTKASMPFQSMRSCSVHSDSNTTSHRQAFGVRLVGHQRLHRVLCRTSSFGDSRPPPQIGNNEPTMVSMSEGGVEALFALVG